MAKKLSAMSRNELLELQKEVTAALKDFDKRKKKEALVAAQKAAKEHGFSLDEILGGKSGSGPKSPPKYANPADPSQTWTGRGRQPGWIKEALTSGKSLDTMAI
ncbi:H-NS histone family protein [Rhodophyticola sp. CCM32]|uniref:H-NS histone family protein n=1 Tax=Rhodophyticola sp. CCM32 TaxID=2916397 RepID=UPI00107F5C17|nr:H-NS histone family protein [Rhodophyticola sp. CCM32]QBX99633.1 H-NS histone family protein [Rhodophyticola sp. CCM32]